METFEGASELREAYRFPGWTPHRVVTRSRTDGEARVVRLTRREKNAMRHVSYELSHVVRSNESTHSRSPVWGVARVLGRVGAARGLPDVWPREAGATRLARAQSALHETLRLVCRPSLSERVDSRGRARTPSGLACGESDGNGIHAGAARRGRPPHAARHRHRRNFDSERPCVSDHCQRFGARATHLVWRHRSRRGEYDHVL